MTQLQATESLLRGAWKQRRPWDSELTLESMIENADAGALEKLYGTLTGSGDDGAKDV